MKCPVCANSELRITDRQGVEIDYCPQCRGVWLDRGELDKILERSNELMRRYDDDDDHDDDDRYRHEQARNRPPYENRPYEKPYKKKSFLGELFDFG